jgi:aldose 1-epimerase
MSIEKTVFGTTKQGNSVSLYTISNQHGTKIAVTDLGATLVKVIVKDKNGTPKDVVLGYDTPQKYEEASKLGQLSGDVRTGSGELLLS